MENRSIDIISSPDGNAYATIGKVQEDSEQSKEKSEKVEDKTTSDHNL